MRHFGIMKDENHNINVKIFIVQSLTYYWTLHGIFHCQIKAHYSAPEHHKSLESMASFNNKRNVPFCFIKPCFPFLTVFFSVVFSMASEIHAFKYKFP